MSKLTTITQGIGTTETKIYTCPTGKNSTISKLSLTNVSESLVNFNISYYNSFSNATTYLAKQGYLDAGTIFDSIGNTNTLDLNVGDYLTVLSTADSSIDIIITYEELDV
jgi:hypothetical protein|tara:strand:+ start:172 stop:501 length:330 start_codon:yes stop_codon:yes gene_type:complete